MMAIEVSQRSALASDILPIPRSSLIPFNPSVSSLFFPLQPIFSSRSFVSAPPLVPIRFSHPAPPATIASGLSQGIAPAPSPAFMEALTPPSMNVDLDAWKEKAKHTAGKYVTALVKSKFNRDPQLAVIYAAHEELQKKVALVALAAAEKGTLAKLSAIDPQNPTDPRTLGVLSEAVGELDLSPMELIKALSRPGELINHLDAYGFNPLHYCIVYDQLEGVELLLEQGCDANLVDTSLVGWTPLMWATHANLLEMVRLLVQYGAESTRQSALGKTCLDLVVPDSEVYDFFRVHGLLARASPSAESDFYQRTHYAEPPAELTTNIRMASAGVGLGFDDGMYQEQVVDPNHNSHFDTNMGTLLDLNRFDFEKLLPDQFIAYTEADLGQLLNYLMGCYTSHSQKPHLPAAIVYQMLRYARTKSPELLTSSFDLFITKVRTTTGTNAGMFAVEASHGDLVQLTYWLSAVNFLYFYLLKDGDFFSKHPAFLVELVLTTQSLVAAIAFSLCNRMDPLLEPCLLAYANLDLGGLHYKNDWNPFKRKETKTSYDVILEMLYPPPPKEQMKPSPVRLTQTLGALAYVLDLYRVPDLLAQQTFSLVLHWLGASLFNRVVARKRYCSRALAIQIRLNLLVVEDWVSSHNRTPKKQDELYSDTFLSTLVGGNVTLSVLRVSKRDGKREGVESDPSNLLFYYQPLTTMARVHFSPVVQLLQWLQCLSHIETASDLSQTLGSLDYLNPVQAMRAIKNYNYEVEEPKFPKPLRLQLEQTISDHGDNLPLRKGLVFAYSTKELHLYLNPEFVFPCTLPTERELIETYGAGIGGVHEVRARLFEPLVPVGVTDEIDEIIQGNRNEDWDDEGGSEEDADEETVASPDTQHAQPLAKPVSVAQREWERAEEVQSEFMFSPSPTRKWNDEIEANPW